MRGKLFLLAVGTLILQACTADVYVPVSHHTPLLEEQGELDGGIYTSTNGTDLHGAYAFWDHLAVGSALSYMHRDFDSDKDFQRHKYGEVSLIYFFNLHDSVFDGRNAFGEKVYAEPERKFKLEFLGSFGLGEGEELRYSGGDEPDEDVYAKGRYSKYSFQSNIGIETEVLAFGVSPKLSYLSYHDFMSRGRSPATPSDNDMTNKTSGVFWEPAVFVAVKARNIRLEAQAGITRILGKQPAFSYERSYVSLGLHVNFDMLK